MSFLIFFKKLMDKCLNKKLFSRELLLPCFFIVILSGCGVEVDPRTLMSNRAGNKALEKGQWMDAQRNYLEALAEDPFIAELHVNLGLTYQALKQGEPATQSYESAEKWGRNPEVLFASRFNQGVLRAENKQIDPALASYQKALEVVPDSIETKTNIELLMQNQKGQGEGQDKNKDQQGNQGQNDQQDQKDSEGQDQKEKKNKEGPKQQSPQYKPREFKGELSEGDVKKILGELKQQEQKIRGQFFRNENQEKPREKDW